MGGCKGKRHATENVAIGRTATGGAQHGGETDRSRHATNLPFQKRLC
jgi:hypothetical protein